MRKALLSILKIYLSTLLIAQLGRLIFTIVYASKSLSLPLSQLLEAFVRGVSLDASVAGYVIALPAILLLLGVVSGVVLSPRVWRWIVGVYLVVIAVAVSLAVTVDANLYGYWGYRIDATLLPYLATPREAAASISFGDVLLSVVIFAAMISASLALYRLSLRGFEIAPLSWRRRLIYAPVTILLLGLIFVMIRGGLSASVANVSKVYFSSSPYANHVAINPIFSLLSSIQRVESYDEIYPFYEEAELERRFERAEAGVTQPILNTSRPNVVIVICEGYTRTILDMEVEGREVMPELRRIAREGLSFDRAYASGSRTDRGVTSVLSGFPSQPLISIMKIPAKSRDLPSLALSLAPYGYSSHFYYGGDLNFMDMSSYLYNTGWETLLYNKDITSAEAPRQWGYSDGVMMDLFAGEVQRLSSLDEPYLATLLTLSSHEPFDVPEQMGFADPLINSFAYSDAHLGAMVDSLRASEAWDDLLLVFVADHTIGYPRGVTYNSPSRHHIPLIFTGGALAKSGVERAIISQGDIPATLLAQMGIDHSPYLFSFDYFDSATPHYAYYTFSHGFGIVDQDGATIYDVTGERVGTGDDDQVLFLDDQENLTPDHSARLDRGKVTLQRSFLEIDRMGQF